MTGLFYLAYRRPSREREIQLGGDTTGRTSLLGNTLMRRLKSSANNPPRLIGRHALRELRADHPILMYIKEGTLDQYLRLDDFVMWASFEEMSNAKDPIVCELATRLNERKLYKAVDGSALLDHRGGAAATARYKAKLAQAKKEGAFGPFDILEHTAYAEPLQATRI